jgi:aromatic ring-opening dioxygenase catalytic subunit (LigB family)
MHPLLFDYSGFPQETYEYSYPAPGDPVLASKIQSLLTEKGLPCVLDAERGWDHGVFVPLLLMFPQATVPVVQVSLHASLDSDTHMRMGEALASLRDEGVLLLGSGLTFHNMGAFFSPTREAKRAAQDFDKWLQTTMGILSALLPPLPLVLSCLSYLPCRPLLSPC